MLYTKQPFSKTIRKLMLSMDFIEDLNKEGIFYHKLWGRDIEFDMTATSEKPDAIRKKVFSIFIQYGKDSKLKEIQSILKISLF